MTWRVERYARESDLEFAVRRLRVASIAAGVALAVVACFWWVFPFSANENAFVLFFGVTVTALAAVIAIPLLLMFLLFAGTVVWYREELRQPALRDLRLRAAWWSGWFLPLLLFGFAGYSLFQLFTTGQIPFYARRTSFLVSSQEHPIVFVVLILFWITVLLGSMAWLGYKWHWSKTKNPLNTD